MTINRLLCSKILFYHTGFTQQITLLNQTLTLNGGDNTNLSMVYVNLVPLLDILPRVKVVH